MAAITLIYLAFEKALVGCLVRNQELARQIERECAAAEKARPPQARRTSVAPPARSADSASAYYAHYENIRQHLALVDLSRVDAMGKLSIQSQLQPF